MVLNDALFNSIHIDQSSSRQAINKTAPFSSELNTGKITVGGKIFSEDDIDVYFSEYAGKSINLPEYYFSNFDSAFPPDEGIKQAFKQISGNHKLAILSDWNTIDEGRGNYTSRILPILQKHIDELMPDERKFKVSDYIYAEGRIHQIGDGKGPFRVFMRWLPVRSTLDGDILTRNTFVVEFYDPFHLVIHHADSISYKIVSSYSVPLKDRYYRSIPTSIRY